MFRARRTTLAVSAAGGLVLSLAGLGMSPPALAAAGPAATSAPQKVIVMLQDQLPGSPPSKTATATRRAAAASSQDAVLRRLAGPAPTHVMHYSLANGFAATVTPDQATALAQDPAVASVAPDRVVALPTRAAASGGGATASARQAAPPVTTTGPDAVCPADPAHPLIEPEALRSVRALTSDGSPYAQQLASGHGVTVGFIADTMDPSSPDFIRPDGSHVFVDYQDFSGAGPSAISDGREAYGDASSIAAQGTVSHDLSQFVNAAHPLPAGCTIKVVGVAPGASLVGLVFGSNASILQSIDYAVTTDHVDVLNESFGLNAFPDYTSRNGLTNFNDAAVAAGVTVTVSSGDAGITNTIGSPPDPKVIQVAATTDNRLYVQTGYAAANFSNGTWASDQISALSSSGISQLGRTVDLAAPGEGNWAACAPAYSGCRNFQSPPQPTDLQSFGGTSESAPLTAGAAALVIEAYRSTHAGASPTPAVVKQIITGTARDIGAPADEQGAGLLDARAATEAALTWPGATAAPAGVASNLVTSTDQLTLTGTPGATQSGGVTVTNVGVTPLIVAGGSRAFTTFAQASRSIAFDSTTLPTFAYYNGAPWVVKKIRFSVAPGGQRLLARMAFQATGPTDIVRLTLLDPSGRLVANSRPQGGPATPNYANVDVTNPVAGQWTAILYSAAGATGYHGAPILFRAETQRATPVGTVTPANFTLAPGASRRVTVSTTVPADSGDTSYAVTFASSGGHQTVVSAIVRALIDTSGSGRYSGVITGGNARAVSPAQQLSYAFDVPSGKRDLDVSLTLGRDPGDLVNVVLLDPHGEPVDVASNLSPDAAGTLTQGFSVQQFDAHPLAGRWHLVVVVKNPVSGAELSQRFYGRVSFDRLVAAAPGVPMSSATVLPRGKAVTATVTVRNPGVQPIAVGVDPRLDQMRTLQPVPIQGSLTFPLPDASSSPTYILPPDTTAFTVAASTTVPALAEIQNGAAGIDVFGDLAGSQAGSSLSVASIRQHLGGLSTGIWFTTVSELGPFTDAGQPTGQATVTASMRTAAFDPAVTSSTDDPFRIAVDPTSNGYGTPVIVAPGASQTITVTITPTGAKGSVVTGHLNLVVPSTLPAGSTGLPQVTTGSVISAIPYSYTIG
ncbi:MAG: S8 family serine peptidase [Lapillicoccus sp.]